MHHQKNLNYILTHLNHWLFQRHKTTIKPSPFSVLLPSLPTTNRGSLHASP